MIPAPKPTPTPRKAKGRTRLTRVNAKRKGSRFPKRRDPEYCAWIRALPCLLRNDVGHRCWGRVQVCHVKSRGAAGDDHGNVVPLCAGAHDEQHRVGLHEFEARCLTDLVTRAAHLYERYQKVRGIAERLANEYFGGASQ